jgi:uncharacterized DUF497 family protein
MEFEWDERKSDDCFQSRGFDFEYAAWVFFDKNKLIKLDDRRSYGEVRYQVTGLIEGRIYVVVFTPRKEKLRIISARKANKREVQHYENNKN